MRQSIRRHLIVTYAISLGLMTVFLSLLQPIPSVSAQQLTGPVSQETSGTGTQGRRIEICHLCPTNPGTRPHPQLIRKPQNPPIASVEPSPSGSSPVSSLPTPPPSPQSDNTTSQSKEPSSLNRSVGAAVPLATMSVDTVVSDNHGIHCSWHSINRNHPAGRCRRGQLVYLRKRRCRWAIDAKISCGDAGVGTIDLAAFGPSTFQSIPRSERARPVCPLQPSKGAAIPRRRP